MPAFFCTCTSRIIVPVWLNIPERVTFKLGLMVFSCLHNQAPRYLVDLCQSVSSVTSRQHLRSASRGLLVVHCHRLSSYGRRAFSVASPAIWNWLPDSLRDLAISRDSFKRSLKTFSFSAYSCTQCIRAFWTMHSTNLLTYFRLLVSSSSSSSLKFLEWPKQQCHHEDHYRQSKYEQYQTVL